MQMQITPADKEKALEIAAKYLCNLLDGRCPLAVEKYPCPTECGPETLPWRCWINYFQAALARSRQSPAQPPAAGGDAAEEQRQAA